MNSVPSLAVAQSIIRHRRFHPKSHSFEYRLKYLWFNPDEIDQYCKGSFFWSQHRFNVLTLSAQDFLANYSGQSIRHKLEDLLQKKENFNLSQDAQIRVLALPRCLGKRFNSVVFYFIFNGDTLNSPEWIVSEITNTPWEQRKAYVHDCRGHFSETGPYSGATFEFDKSFHVSPFLPMALKYKWRFHWSPEKQFINMQVFKESRLVFDAVMQFQLYPVTTASQQHIYALSGVFQPMKMQLGIYWQALRLWKLSIPFYPNPHKGKYIDSDENRTDESK